LIKEKWILTAYIMLTSSCKYFLPIKIFWLIDEGFIKEKISRINYKKDN